jgi:hypothetical protein
MAFAEVVGEGSASSSEEASEEEPAEDGYEAAEDSEEF